MEEGGSSEQNGQQQRRPRPESTMALDFSQTLDGLFGLAGPISELDQTVQQKKQFVSSQSRELEELEARLKAAEERLKRAAAETGSATTGQKEPQPAASSAAPSRQAPPAPTGMAPPARAPPARAPPAAPGAYAGDDSTGTMPGAMPNTPSDRQNATDYYAQGRS